MKIQKICKVCEKSFLVIPSRLQKGEGKYCSLKCSGFDLRTQIPKKCLECGSVFLTRPKLLKIGKGKYCSRKCMSIAFSRTIIKNCLKCGTEFTTLPSIIQKGNGKFCSIMCEKSLKLKIADENFFKAKQFQPFPPRKRTWTDIQWSRRIKKRDKNCGICGNSTMDAHHLFERVFYPLLWLSENNGHGLCKLCHHQVHGRKLGIYPSIKNIIDLKILCMV